MALPACVGHRFSRPLGRSPATAHIGRRVLRSTAPREQPKTPENSLKSEFSTVWKKFFHCVEKMGLFFHSVETFFPLCGKIAKKFSIVWKTSWTRWAERIVGRTVKNVRITYELN